MRQMVEEKLQKTLNERIGQSFEIVRSQLENVQKGMGEMKGLAQDVGGLKKVLSNVKTRGTFGEVPVSYTHLDVYKRQNPLFTLPLYSAGMSVDSVLFYRYALAIVVLGIMTVSYTHLPSDCIYIRYYLRKKTNLKPCINYFVPWEANRHWFSVITVKVWKG